MERWIEVYAGFAPDGFPETKYIHESCESKAEHAYPYCPYCGKKMTHIRIIDDDFKECMVRYYTNDGFICE